MYTHRFSISFHFIFSGNLAIFWNSATVIAQGILTDTSHLAILKFESFYYNSSKALHYIKFSMVGSELALILYMYSGMFGQLSGHAFLANLEKGALSITYLSACQPGI